MWVVPLSQGLGSAQVSSLVMLVLQPGQSYEAAGGDYIF